MAPKLCPFPAALAPENVVGTWLFEGLRCDIFGLLGSHCGVLLVSHGAVVAQLYVRMTVQDDQLRAEAAVAYVDAKVSRDVILDRLQS